MHTQAPPPVDNQAALSADDLEASLWRLFTGPSGPPSPRLLVPLLMGWAHLFALGQCRLAVAAADASHAAPLGLVHWRASPRRTGCGQAAGTAACTDLPGEVTCRHNGCARAGRR